tara:strand:- start:31616 stop:31822 length:207 start_codon:yes stop_codon:yes gene_type:complete
MTNTEEIEQKLINCDCKSEAFELQGALIRALKAEIGRLRDVIRQAAEILKTCEINPDSIMHDIFLENE